MADFSRIFDVGLALTFLDKFTGPTSAALDRMNELEKRTARLQQTFTTFVGGGSAMGAVGSRIFDSFREPIHQAASFESAMSEVALALDPNKFNLAVLAEDTKRLSAQYGRSAVDIELSQTIFEAFTDIVHNNSEAMIANEAAAKFAILRHISFGESLTIGMQLLKNYGLGIENINMMYDILAKSQLPLTSASIGMLTHLGEATHIAWSGLLAITKEFLPLYANNADEAAGATDKFIRYISDIGSAMLTPGVKTAALRQQIAMLGGDAFASAFKMVEVVRNGQKVQEFHVDYAKALDAIADSQMGYAALLEVFGKKEADNIYRLLQNRKAIVASAQSFANAYGTLNAQYVEKMKEEEEAANRVKVAWENLRSSIGDKVLPTYTKFLDLLDRGFIRMQRFIDAHPALAKAVLLPLGGLATLAVGVGGVLTAIGFVGTGVLTLTRFAAAMQGASAALNMFTVAQGAATTGAWAFTTALLSNPLTWVVLGAVAAGIAVYELHKYWSSWLKDVEKDGKKLSAMQKVFSFSDWFFGATPESERKQVEMRSKTWSWITNLARDIAGFDWRGTLSGAEKDITSLGSRIISSLKPMISEIYNWGANLVESAIHGMESKISGIPLKFKTALHEARKFFGFSIPTVGPFSDINRIALIDEIAKTVKPDPLVSRLASIMQDARNTISMGGLSLGMEGAFAGPEMAVPGVGRSGTINVTFAGDIIIEGADVRDARELADVFAQSASMKIQSALRGRFRI